MKFNSAFATTLSAVAVSTVMGISAAPVFSADFTISNSSGMWSNVVLDNNSTINPPGGNTVEFLNGDSEVRWGVPVNIEKSGLAFNGVNNLSFDVGEIFKIGTLTHFNRPTFSPAATAADLGIALNFNNPGGLSKMFNFTFGIDNTPNVAANCPGDNPPCDDIISFPNVLPSETFEFMGMTFTLELVKFADTIDGSGTNQFVSPEGEDNSTMLFGKITKVDVPEPGSILGLLFLGGLGASSLQSRKSKSRLK
jgi:hypothetical protein